MKGYFIAEKMHGFSQFALVGRNTLNFGHRNLRHTGSHYLVFSDVTEFAGWVDEQQFVQRLGSNKNKQCFRHGICWCSLQEVYTQNLSLSWILPKLEVIVVTGQCFQGIMACRYEVKCNIKQICQGLMTG